ncbi:peptidase S58 DmpA [Ameyamaea chiangmaiensis NBRC 103196]|uniref:P1 family peptidase n=1 Tax=Ameyamaea chiangmaiensis TaxID=442969 RepID=A0A850PC05_9PROT|nr:P1 family peptidase [Ameyamaea chiangmaiensis]MBS4076638.1 P1 family peptidase [Ameyamaea chiangmaiensis]NVN41644.1 P1 family peptidase [Ameyamaea chiangmaiensis]GBQ65880.1 peptidase S58 DmpA [Ameyamaea chiangmaiensis NBRC 103196]
MKRRSFLGAASWAAIAPAWSAPKPGLGPFGPGAPGPLNLITDVAGLKIGLSNDAHARTGVTVIVPDARAAAAVDVRGGGPGTRETDALTAGNLVRSVDAIVLSGGSVYGLASADGVAAWLGARGRGFSMAKQPGVPPSPIVPTAILFDLANGGDKAWGMDPPYRALGVAAIEHAAAGAFPLGTVGAGYGAGAGSLKGGLGSASWRTGDGMTVGAVVGVNSLGSVVVPGTHNFWAGALEHGHEFGGLGPSSAHVDGEDWGLAKINPGARANTTIACIATDVALDADELRRVAIMAQDGLARAIRPIHSPFDGDVIFALSTAQREVPTDAPRPFVVARLGALAADVLSRSVARGVYEATLPPGMQGKTWRDL